MTNYPSIAIDQSKHLGSSCCHFIGGQLFGSPSPHPYLSTAALLELRSLLIPCCEPQLVYFTLQRFGDFSFKWF